MSWLYDPRDQLNGYRLYAEIAHRFKPRVLPEDRDDIERDIVIKLKEEAERHTRVTPAFLIGCATNIVRTYCRKKCRERRRVLSPLRGAKGEMITGKWKFVTPALDIEDRIDARATLQTLPKRMIEARAKRGGKKLNNADKLYLCRQRHKISKFNWTSKAEVEQLRHLYIDEGLSSPEVAKKQVRVGQPFNAI